MVEMEHDRIAWEQLRKVLQGLALIAGAGDGQAAKYEPHAPRVSTQMSQAGVRHVAGQPETHIL